MYLGSFSNIKCLLSHSIFLQTSNWTSLTLFLRNINFFFIPPPWTPTYEAHHLYTVLFLLLLRPKAPVSPLYSWYRHPGLIINFSWMMLSCARDRQPSPTFIQNGVFSTFLLLFLVHTDTHWEKMEMLTSNCTPKQRCELLNVKPLVHLSVLAFPQMQTHMLDPPKSMVSDIMVHKGKSGLFSFSHPLPMWTALYKFK
jgi:hypothetical protein